MGIKKRLNGFMVLCFALLLAACGSIGSRTEPVPQPSATNFDTEGFRTALEAALFARESRSQKLGPCKQNGNDYIVIVTTTTDSSGNTVLSVDTPNCSIKKPSSAARLVFKRADATGTSFSIDFGCCGPDSSKTFEQSKPSSGSNKVQEAEFKLDGFPAYRTFKYVLTADGNTLDPVVIVDPN